MKVFQVEFNDTPNKLFCSPEHMAGQPWTDMAGSIVKITVIRMTREKYQDLPEFEV